MKILHYILGFPPKRSGGLTKYALDLMLAEKELGCRVYAVYPGNGFPLAKKMRICVAKSFKDVACFEMKNALPVPLLYGISKTAFFRIAGTEYFEIFDVFFRENHFDVLHLHTMMGLPISFLAAAKKNGVKIIYTSHDYFGLCPRVNFVNLHGEVCDGPSPEKCTLCNRDAKTVWFLWIRNSWLSSILKRIFR